MRFYSQQHRFYCGVDLHARSMHVCIVDADGQTKVHKNIDAHPDRFLPLIRPYRQGLAVAAECMFAWYWLADLCAQEQIPFVLGHALYRKAIHGGKAKNDKIDSQKIALMLKGGMLPIAYAYPKAMRATRDLLRRRTKLVRTREPAAGHGGISRRKECFQREEDEEHSSSFRAASRDVWREAPPPRRCYRRPI